MTRVVIVGGTAPLEIVAMNPAVNMVKLIAVLMAEVLTPTAGANRKLLSPETSVETHRLTCSK